MPYRPLARVAATVPTVIAAFLFCASLGLGGTSHAGQADLGQAREFVRALDLARNLPGMIMRTALQTPTIQKLAAKHGGVAVFHALKLSTFAIASKYDAAWTENLAKSYAAHFSDTELAAILVETEQAARLRKIKAKETRVGNTMRDLSFDLLGKATTEAVTQVVEQFPGS